MKFGHFSISVSRKNITLIFHLSCALLHFVDCQCYLNGTIAGSNICEKSVVSNGSCLNRPGCKYGYNGNDCGTCNTELGYENDSHGNDSYGNCDRCIEQFFISLYFSDGRPKCQRRYSLWSNFGLHLLPFY